MKILTFLENITSYLTEAFTRIFSPEEETPPEIGTQPYDCALYSEE